MISKMFHDFLIHQGFSPERASREVTSDSVLEYSFVRLDSPTNFFNDYVYKYKGRSAIYVKPGYGAGSCHIKEREAMGRIMRYER